MLRLPSLVRMISRRRMNDSDPAWASALRMDMRTGWPRSCSRDSIRGRPRRLLTGAAVAAMDGAASGAVGLVVPVVWGAWGYQAIEIEPAVRSIILSFSAYAAASGILEHIGSIADFQQVPEQLRDH